MAHFVTARSPYVRLPAEAGRMTVNLTPDLEAFVAAEVAAGRFASAEALLTAAVLRLRDEAVAADVDDDEFTADDEAALDEAEADVAAGRVRDFTEVAAELLAKARGS